MRFTARSLFGLKPHSEGSRCAWVSLLLAGIVVWTFWDVRYCDFNFLDDIGFVVNNPHIRDGLTWKGLKWAWTADLLKDSANSDYWQPVTVMSRQLDVQLFGMDPGMHHWMNLMFHLANTLLLFLILHRMTGMMWRSAMVAVLFAVHPTRVESVAWVTERKDELAGLFWILAIWAYWWYTRAPDWRRYLLVALCFALGLMSKPMVITLPCVLLLLDFWPLQRLPLDWEERGVWVKRILEKAPLVLLMLMSAALTLKAQGAAMQDHSLPHMTGNALSSYSACFAKQILPVRLSLHYPRDQAPFTAVDASLDLSLLVVLVLAFRFARRWPWLTTGWCWFLGTLVPVLFVDDIVAADRFSYIPSIGLFIAVVWGAAEAARLYRCPRGLVGMVSAFVILALAVGSRLQVQNWKNSEIHGEYSLRINPDDYMAQYCMANVRYLQGRKKEALAHMRRSLEIGPKNPAAFNNLGTMLGQMGQDEEARKNFIEATRLDSHYVQAFYNLGKLLQNHGSPDEALQHYQEVVRLEPEWGNARYNMGNIYREKGQMPEAIASYQAVLKSDPEFDKAHNNLGICLARQGKLDEAIQHYTEAIRLNSHEANVHHNLGIALTRQGRFNEAIASYEKALRYQPGMTNAMNALKYARKLQKSAPVTGVPKQ